MRTVLPMVTLALLSLSSPAGAKWRTVRCLLESGGERYSGPCQFSAEKGGTFSLQTVKAGGTLLGATVVTVAMLGDGTAEVRGLTKDGVNSRWGDVSRSKSDRACWEGEDLKVCAW